MYSNKRIEKHIDYAIAKEVNYGESESSMAHSNIAIAMIRYNQMVVESGSEMEFIKKSRGSTNVTLRD